jgi:DNA-binding NarL/FixJ family response regulator
MNHIIVACGADSAYRWLTSVIAAIQGFAMNVVLAVRQAHARLALELLLSEEPGVIIVGAASETEGLLALTRTAHPDLVVLEWGLPGRPAEAVLAEAHALAGWPRFLVLGCDPGLKPGALQAGADAFVLVGDPPELLLAALREVRAALRG